MAMPLQPQEVQVGPLSPEHFRDVLDPAAWTAFEHGLERARGLLEGRVLWNVNSTPAGGGVAEMLRFFVAYARGAGLDVRWSVIAGTPEFFVVTKRIHNFLHGEPGDGGELGASEREVYAEVTRDNADGFLAVIRPDDVVILHDPQTAGLVPMLKECGAAVIWRSHVGAETPNERVHAAWEFLHPFITEADACVFTRRAYLPPWANPSRTAVIKPSIDAFSPKNQELEPDIVRAILAHVGLIVADVPAGVLPVFTRYDGSPGRVDRRCEVFSSGPPPSATDPVVTQVSRWDRLKDPLGVMRGFAEHGIDGTDAHLVLAGPNVYGVADDPEGAIVFNEVEEAWRALPAAKRARVHLASLPMADIDENAAIVNAIQRHASVVVQKSIQEGFGLTVAEGMWKSRPVVASAVGGIKDQIEDGRSGVLIADPHDLRAYGEAALGLLRDPERASAIGARARERVRKHFLADRHALQYVALLESLFKD
jgi:trehalose synthase